MQNKAQTQYESPQNIMATGYKNIVGFSKERLCETTKIFFSLCLLFMTPGREDES